MTEKLEQYQRIFKDVQALYLVVKTCQDEQGLPIRRAQLKSTGEIAAEAIDFLCDVELKAKRVLSPIEFIMFQYEIDLLPEVQSELGRVFYKCRLGVTGDYKSLYFQTRQVMEGNAGCAYGKAADALPTMDEYEGK